MLVPIRKSQGKALIGLFRVTCPPPINHLDVEDEGLDLPGWVLCTTAWACVCTYALEEFEERYDRKIARTTTSLICYWHVLRINKI